MSRLDRLTIQGIRSFSPDDRNILEFHTPLTLIVGANGTGKTTIIECLKYTTTGDMPPSSRGGAFVYDPRIAGKIDVRAELCLKFVNNNNETLVCTRSMQSSLRKGRTEQKTLDSTLSKETSGRAIVLASKLGDIDRDVPDHLGVGASILENVIFCHQDEGTWPLGDPTAMKKKLDDIFSSTKYSKALLGLKSSKKEINADLRLKVQQTSFLLKEKLKRDEITKSIQKYRAEVERKSQKLRIFGEEIQRVLPRIALVENDLKLFEKLEQNHRVLTIELENCRRFVGDFSSEVLVNFDRASVLRNIELLEKRQSDLCGASIEEEFSGVERLRKRAMEEVLRNNSICKSIEQNEAVLSELADERRSLAECLATEFSCNENELEEKLEEVFRLAENSIRERSNDLEEHRKELFLLKSRQLDAERTLREHQLFIERYRDLKPTGIDVDSPDEINYERRTELEEIVGELLEEVNLKQSKLNAACKLSEDVFEKICILKDINRIRASLGEKSASQLSSKIAEASTLLRSWLTTLEPLEAQNVRIKSRNLGIFNEVLSLSKQLDVNKENRSNGSLRACLRSLTPDSIRESLPREFLELEVAKETGPLEAELDGHKDIVATGARVSAISTKSTELGKNKLEKTVSEIRARNSELDHRNSIRLEIGRLIDEIEDGVSVVHLNDVAVVMGKIEGILADLMHRLEQDRALTEQLRSLELDFLKLPDSIDLDSAKEDLDRTKVLLETRKTELASFNAHLKSKEEMLRLIEAERDNLRIIQRRDELIEESRNAESTGVDDLEEIIRRKELRLERLRETLAKKKTEVEIKVSRLNQVKAQILEKEAQIQRSKSQIVTSDVFVHFNSEKITLDALKSDQEFERARSVVMAHKNGMIEISRSLDAERHSLRVIDENVELRKAKERVFEIESELKSFDAIRYARLREKHASYVEKKAKMTDQESTVRGELKQLGHVLRNLNADIDSNYKDTCKNYLRSSIEIRALELGLEDLDKCVNGLDKAIVDFHSSKIEEINRTLRDLWSSTYRGSDIEYVELKSESSGTRAYNYRMVMVKSGAELDMRGRSSAGQKMIASILFRIALADSFSCGCSILALDEPTTNLDRDNIEGLAYTLSQIIRERADVQMIIITHDEEFVQMMNREGTEYFYRLRRDSIGNNHIERHSIYK